LGITAKEQNAPQGKKKSRRKAGIQEFFVGSERKEKVGSV